MKKFTALLLAAALAAPLASTAATAHDHHGSAETHQLQLNAGEKWVTDAPLRQAMTAIRQSTTQILPAAHTGKVTVADYNAFGDAVGKQVSFLVENCKLPPEADAQLHLIVAKLVEGVEAAQGKQGDAQRAAGVVQIAQASNAYGQYFDHGGWKSIELPH